MSNKDPARLIDVINALEAVKGDTSRRLRRDGSNVDMTPEQAAAFRAAIGAGSGGGGGGSGDVVGPSSSTQNALAQFADGTGKLLKGGPLIGVSSPGSLPTRADSDGRYQAKAAGLTALAGLNAPGLYYLSDVDAWSPVTIGAGLDFASGTLTATGGGGGGGSGDVTGPASATADSLVLFSGTTGKVIKGGPALGVGSAGSVPTRADADERYQSKLGFTPADAADTYTKDEVDAAFDALPDPPAVPTFATVAEVRAGNVDGKIISPKVMADALATVVIARTDAAVGINFSTFINAQIVLDANGTLGPPSGGYPGQTGLINVSNATGSATLAFASAYRMPKGGITIEAGVNASTRIPYMISDAGTVILFPASKWSS